jgi:glycosyltransferase involved in cell wall biosynthesis
MSSGDAMGGHRYARLAMLGTAPGTRGGIAAVVKVYRAHGHFERWPIDYIATHCDGGVLRKLLVGLRALFSFLALLARHGRVILHVHSASHWSFWRKSVFMAIGHAAGCPVIFHLHGGGYARFYEKECGPLRRRLIRYFLDRAACIVVLSRHWGDWISGITSNPRIVSAPNPVLPGEASRSPRSGHTLLFLGRIEQAKGILDLLEAMAALRPEMPAVRLVCAGEGDTALVLRHAERLGIADAVFFTGWIGPAEVRAWMNRSAAFVLPSYTEAMPMSLLEAMAAGLPVVATAVGGIPDVVTDGHDGFLFSPGDVATLEKLLRVLLEDRTLAARLGAAARSTIEKRFSADRVMARLNEVYSELGLAPASGASETVPQQQPLGEPR